MVIIGPWEVEEAPVEEGKDFFIGTWEGNLSGTTIEKTRDELIKTSFMMEIHNIKVVPDPTYQRYFTGEATLHYSTPIWTDKGAIWTREFEVKDKDITGQIKGWISSTAEGGWVLALDHGGLEPEGTMIATFKDSGPTLTTPLDSILGVLFGRLDNEVIYKITKTDPMELEYIARWPMEVQTWNVTITGSLKKTS